MWLCAINFSCLKCSLIIKIYTSCLLCDKTMTTTAPLAHIYSDSWESNKTWCSVSVCLSICLSVWLCVNNESDSNTAPVLISLRLCHAVGFIYSIAAFITGQSDNSQSCDSEGAIIGVKSMYVFSLVVPPQNI